VGGGGASGGLQAPGGRGGGAQQQRGGQWGGGGAPLEGGEAGGYGGFSRGEEREERWYFGEKQGYLACQNAGVASGKDEQERRARWDARDNLVSHNGFIN